MNDRLTPTILLTENGETAARGEMLVPIAMDGDTDVQRRISVRASHEATDGRPGCRSSPPEPELDPERFEDVGAQRRALRAAGYEIPLELCRGVNRSRASGVRAPDGSGTAPRGARAARRTGPR